MELEDYKKLNKIPECCDMPEISAIFKIANKNNLPFLIIKKEDNYGQIKYDMITTNYELKNKTIMKIEELLSEMDNLTNLKDKGSYSCSSINGNSQKSDIDICKLYAVKIKEIIFNEDSWTSSNSFYSKSTCG